ncbi:MAG: NAD-dependent epimerase/dehydratase family protein [Nannocystales bacterium]
MARVAVTGSTGHLGPCLIRQLLADGHEVRALIRDEKAPPSLEGLDIEIVRGDICQPSTLKPLVEGAERVYHLAALISIVGPMDGKVRAVNVHGARNVGEAALAAGAKRMVHVSSVHAFELGVGQTGKPRTIDETHKRSREETCPAYDASKAAGEVEIRKLVDKGLDAVIVHPSGVIGPFDFSPSRMGKVLLSLGNGRMPALLGGGFDWVDVRDVGQGIRAAADKGRTGESYILSGNFASIPDLAHVAANVTGRGAPKLTMPLALANFFAPAAEATAKLMRMEPLYTEESLMALRSDVRFERSKAGVELDYRPRPLLHTLRDVYAWFAAHGSLKSPAAELQPERYGAVLAA